MLKLEESPPFEYLGPGPSQRLITLTWGEQGKTNLLFLKKSKLSEQNSQDILSGVVRLGGSLRPSLASNIKAVHYSML